VKISATVIARNDGYGGNLLERATYCLNSLIHTFDEVIFVDWNSPGDLPLIYAIEDNILKTGKLKTVIVTQDQARYLTNNDAQASPCCEVLARNVAARRASGDMILATNIDIVVVNRQYLRENELDHNTFYTFPRRHIDLAQFKHIPAQNVDELQTFLYANREVFWQHGLGGAGAYPGEKWSLVCCCGDFQLAHKDIWYKIRGFEESMIYRNFADTNIQKKADLCGFGLAAKQYYDIFHINHGTQGSPLKGNNAHVAVRDFTKTSNSDNWGHPEIEFKEVIL
jgi:hypothetical protein